jgi:uncharacterized YigZ family protein
LEGYTTIAELVTAEHVEKRSRFLSLAAPVSDEESAIALLSELRTKYWDATHNCYAYILRSGNIQRYSDDGEPQGTAGMPILEVLRRQNLTDVMVVVTRYFGGTLLGAGGLVRAYTLGATLVLERAKLLQMRPCTIFTLTLDYSLYGKLQYLLSDFGATTLKDDFGAQITLTLRMETDKLSAFSKQLSELSAGSLAPNPVGEEFAPVERG